MNTRIFTFQSPNVYKNYEKNVKSMVKKNSEIITIEKDNVQKNR